MRAPVWPLVVLSLGCPGSDAGTRAIDDTSSDGTTAARSDSDAAASGPGDTPGASGAGPDSAGDEPTDGGGSAGPGSDSEEVPAGPVTFTEVAAQSGLTYVQGEYHTPPNCLVDATEIGKPGHFCTAEWYAGGVAAGDYDGDGDLDLFATRIYADGVLLQGDGAGGFVERGAEAGITAPNTNGAAWADIDNDDDLDLYLTSIGGTRHFLYVNDGAGHFSEQGLARGATISSDVVHTGNTPAFGDYDLDGYLDVFVGEYRTHFALGDGPSHARLLHNRGVDGPGTFEDVTDAAGVALEHVHETIAIEFPIAGVLALSPGFADLDDDGFPDLVVTSDFGCSRLFWNQGDGTFVDGTVASGVGTDENGMGAAISDFDGDGDLDWFVTSISGTAGKTGNRMYRNEGGRVFTDATDLAGVRDGGWGWGAAFLDHDNDADLDLVMTNGWTADLYLMDRMRLWDNDGAGVMQQIGARAGVDDSGMGRALVTLDHDRDGDQDLLVVNFAGAPLLLRNDTVNDHGWLRVAVRGDASNHDGRGARVRVRATPGAAPQVREIGTTSLFLGHSELVAHFGLGPGSAPVAELEVVFPATGETVVLTDVARDQQLTVFEP